VPPLLRLLRWLVPVPLLPLPLKPQLRLRLQVVLLLQQLQQAEQRLPLQVCRAARLLLLPLRVPPQQRQSRGALQLPPPLRLALLRVPH
jgi:hypothetical protein